MESAESLQPEEAGSIPGWAQRVKEYSIATAMVEVKIVAVDFIPLCFLSQVVERCNDEDKAVWRHRCMETHGRSHQRAQSAVHQEEVATSLIA